MSAQDLEQQARELLAAEYERDGKAGSADHIRTQPLMPNKARAVRAIAAALRQQPAPVVSASEVFRIAGGDTECEPNPTPERALEVLRDLRACYDEALCDQPAPVVDVLVAVRHEIEAAKHELDTVTATDDAQSDGIGCAENALDRALAILAGAQGVQS